MRRIHQKLHTVARQKPAEKAKKKTAGGPGAKIARGEGAADEQQYDSLILQLNGTCAKSGKQILQELIISTFQHRNSLRQINPQSILLIYTKFKECDFMVSKHNSST